MPYYPPMAGYGAPGYPQPMPGGGGYASYGSAANPGGVPPNPYGGAAPNYPRGDGNFQGEKGSPGNDPNTPPGGYPRPAYGYGGAMPYGYGYPAQPGPGAGGPPPNAGAKPAGNDESGGYGAYRGAAGSQRADRGYRPY
eukprot:gene26767-33733_t